MSQSTSIATKQPEKQRFSDFMGSESTQAFLMQTLGNEQSTQRFGAAIIAAVSINPALQECTYPSIVAGALLGEALKLSPSPQLGHYYLVPFKQKEKTDKQTGEVIQKACTKATFVLGYKGYVQLAMRSGMYREFNVVEIHEGEIVKRDRLTDRIVIRDLDDATLEKAPVVGYYAMFELMNGFTKSIYWTLDKMLAHADHYSPAFSAQSYRDIQAKKIPAGDMWKYSSFWYVNFDDMAKKTLIRHLISRWGIMSIEMQSAFDQDDTLNTFVGNQVITEAREQIDEATIAGALAEAVTPPAEKATINLDEV